MKSFLRTLRRMGARSLLNRHSLVGRLNSMIILMTLAFCALTLCFVLLFYHFTLSRQREQSAAASVQRAASSLNLNAEDILQRFIRICSDSDFLSAINTLKANPENVYLNRQNLTPFIIDLENSHYLISSVLFASAAEPHRLYLSYNAIPTADDDGILTAQDFLNIRGISWLPQRQDPFSSVRQVIPLVIPIHLKDGFVQIVRGEQTALAYAVLFIDSERLSASLTNTGLSERELNYDLLRGDGTLISGTKNQALHQRLENYIQSGLANLSETGGKREILHLGPDTLFIRRLSFPSLYLLCHFRQESPAELLLNTGSSLAITLLLILVLMLGITLFMRRFVTKPILALSDVVRRIRTDTYEQPLETGSRDELGQLLLAVNDMHATISAQKAQIKSEEAAKYQAQLRLLNEQINPHFLYNTLEEIQSEVLRQNTDIAASMIQYLADYLRITLSGGADLITIANELRHVNAYIKIMNQRFGKSILFMPKVEPGLSERKVLKTILQPFVENSIRHGFGIDASGMPTSAPMIELSFSRDTEAGCLCIGICDNGKGFDAAQVLALMRDGAGAHSHIGVQNVYHRLQAYYGAEQIEITASSIPYYQNQISIRIYSPLYEE